MKITDIKTFFEQLDRRIDFKLKVTLTGGAAAILMGVKRATQDIDFEVEITTSPQTKRKRWEILQRELAQVELVTRITPQYSEDIDRWSSIVMPSKKSNLWQKVGKVEVRLLAPGLWAIGKLARYLASDESDLVTVLSHTGEEPSSLVKLWGQALGKSPSSSAQPIFRKHVQVFLEKHATEIWGEKIIPEKIFEIFLGAARKKAGRIG